jgi:di/tricarboxylate transporter
MVYGVGGYRFSDFARIGVPLDLVAMTLTVAIAPLAFPF